MKDPWEGLDRPATSTNLDWLTQITSNPLWGGWAGAPGETRYINPSSGPLSKEGVTGTGASAGAGGIPLGGTGTPGATLNPAAQLPGYAPGASGLGAGMSGSTGMAGLLSKIRPQDWALLAMGLGPQLIGMARGQDELPYGDEMERLIAQLTRQQQQADPLRQAVLSWAQGLVPTRG